MTLLRMGGGNPNHKSSGPGGGQFTSGGGSGHGKHWAKRQRAKKKRLDALRKKGHAAIDRMRKKHASERKSLRAKQRTEGKSYSARKTESKALRDKHRQEGRDTIKSLKSEARASSPKSSAKKFSEHHEAVAQRETHKTERKDMRDDQRGEIQKQSKEHQEARKEFGAGARQERDELRQGHTKEREDLIAKHQEDHKELIKSMRKDVHDDKKILKADKATKEEHEENRKFHVQNRREAISENRETLNKEYKGLREQQRQTIGDHKQDVANDWKALKKDQHQERQETRAQLKGDREWLTGTQREERQELRKKITAKRSMGGIHEFQELGQRSQWPATEERRVIRGGVGANTAQVVPKRFGSGRLHKASSAEAILGTVLRGRGWTVAFRRDELTGRQHLSLLEDVRQYGRSWLRHEAEAFFDRYGVEDEQRTYPVHDERVDVWNAAERSVCDSEAVQPLCPTIRDHSNLSGVVLGPKAQERGLASRAAGALSRFFTRAKNFVHELIIAGGMALKGDYELDAAELAILNNQATIQREYLDKFQREVTANPPREILDLGSSVITIGPAPMTPGQFIARAELYGNSVWEAAQRANHWAITVFPPPFPPAIPGHGGPIQLPPKPAPPFAQERRILGRPKTEHCPDCPPIAALGWQPIGTLPMIGDTECGGLCLCHFEFRVDPASKPVVKPPRPDKDRPHNIPRPKPPEGKQAEPPKPESPVATPVPAKEVPKPKPAKSDNYPPARPVPTIKELIKESGSPHPVDYYEEL